jgi:endonuclease/exonuclease/phosphatase family metal-dependent hydrolase
VPHQYGTLIISRLPILECTNTPLRRVGTTEQRGLLKTLINVHGVPLQFYYTHLHTMQADRLVSNVALPGEGSESDGNADPSGGGGRPGPVGL